jgi:hypothetical protein
MGLMKLAREMLALARNAHPALIVAMVWFVLSLVIPLASGFTRDRWMLQENPRATFLAAAAWTVLWLLMATVPLGLAHVHLTIRILGVLAVWSALTAWFAGPAVLTVINATGTSAADQPVKFNNVHRTGNIVQLKATGLDGVVFTCSASKWHEHCEHASRAARSDIRGTVHRGRLGLWWGEIP